MIDDDSNDDDGDDKLFLFKRMMKQKRLCYLAHHFQRSPTH